MSNQVFLMTSDELTEFAKKVVENLGNGNAEALNQEGKRYVYGLRGIRDLFNVSHATAQRYKNSFLKPAVTQRGRKIIVDANMALELFNQHQSA